MKRWDHGPARPLIQLNTSDGETASADGQVSIAVPSSTHSFNQVNGLAQPTLALIGNKEVMVDIRKMEMMVNGQILPLPIASTTAREMSEVGTIDGLAVRWILRAPHCTVFLRPTDCPYRKHVVSPSLLYPRLCVAFAAPVLAPSLSSGPLPPRSAVDGD